MKFEAISRKINVFVNNCFIKVWIWKSFRTRVTNMIMIFFQQISFLLKRFLVEYRFLFRILRFLAQNHLALLKDRFCKKMLIKRAKTIGSNILENIFRFFKIAKLEFKVRVQYGLKQNASSYDPLSKRSWNSRHRYTVAYGKKNIHLWHP